MTKIPDNIQEKQEILSLGVYTDGSCLGNPGKGGWCACIFVNSAPKHKATLFSYNDLTTNNAMELRAVVAVAEFCRGKQAKITLYTDSTYVCSVIRSGRQWLKEKKPRPNYDLIEKLFSLLHPNTIITTRLVKAHSGNKYNNFADLLAQQAARKKITSSDYKNLLSPTKDKTIVLDKFELEGVCSK